MQTLNQILGANLQSSGPDFYKSRVPDSIYQNLRKGFGKRSYQQEAFGRFVYYWNEYYNKPNDVPIQLLFHMATGSGKTLIMAGIIVYLYDMGYRNFLFFVNSSNIIEKTRANFLNPFSSKYLFSDNISIGDKQIRIKEVENFQAVNQDDINIVFSTIQGLHTRLNTPKENSLTYDDFEDNKIVLISDEAHHINTETKNRSKLSSKEKKEIYSWEGTVSRIFNANKENILLEFTATADLSNPEIAKKYKDKLIFDYPLRQFRKDGYSKEVKVLQSDLLPLDRALQGILLSQYRRKVFERNKLLIKPVVLFKSKTIKESQSFLEQFISTIKKLKVSDLEKIKYYNEESTIQKVFSYISENNISFEDFISELKEDFSEDKLISVNSKNESEEKQLAINSLEDENNEYRAVFAVDKLNEGWDVLNLFDIVRLYDTRDSKAGKPGKTTISEAQLIGRGARYCPFQLAPEQSYYVRKYDDDIENELRICEELYYHSAYNPRYIKELNTALEEIGIKPKATKKCTIKLKEEFKKTHFYRDGYLFLNERLKYNREDVFGLKSTLIENPHKVTLKTGYSKSSIAFNQQNSTTLERKEKNYMLVDFGEHIIRKALNKLEFYKFSNLLKYLPNLNSISEFISSDDYLGKIKLEISGLPEQVNILSQKEKLDATIEVLNNISSSIASDKIEFKGTKEFKPYMLKDIIRDKTLNINYNEGSDAESGRSMNDPNESSIHLDLSKRNWYAFNDCFGTTEEKYLIKYIDKIYESLVRKYDLIYFVRSERHFKIYNFEDGRPFEPDFLLFLMKENSSEILNYQVFIEAKGEQLLKKDEWKENFLKTIKEDHFIQPLLEDSEYVIWGLPFYNERLKKSEFEKYVNTNLLK